MLLFIVNVVYTSRVLPETGAGCNTTSGGGGGSVGRADKLLNREQTEEWKGWMQVMFVWYHYYRAAETYNLIRLFIASYVWMTGFGKCLFINLYIYILRTQVTGQPFESVLFTNNLYQSSEVLAASQMLVQSLFENLNIRVTTLGGRLFFKVLLLSWIFLESLSVFSIVVDIYFMRFLSLIHI